ncbi:MAG: prepilin-type N-terminal cleavage/methylation domain-containing protein [Deltaproteobacteria bacterium]|nr:prepilin-type N-terminal cleavage/methylation domain-containing protein [Deltaproteobacteria bacterium]
MSIKFMYISRHEKGFTFIEIIIACLILTFLIAAVLQYHASSGASKNQEYLLKAVQSARAEMEKLRIMYSFHPDIEEFDHTGPPPQKIFLFKYGGWDSDEKKHLLDTPEPIFKIYYKAHEDTLLKQTWGKQCDPNDETCSSGVSWYQKSYCESRNQTGFEETDTIDKRTYTYFTDDGNTTTDFTKYHKETRGFEIDASLVVIDDMGSPTDSDYNDCTSIYTDDLLGNIGWWVEDAGIISGVTPHIKKITFALQFWYPGQDWTSVDPEVIVLKTTFVKP